MKVLSVIVNTLLGIGLGVWAVVLFFRGNYQGAGIAMILSLQLEQIAHREVNSWEEGK